MGGVAKTVPEALGTVLRHARRFGKLLAALEAQPGGSRWFVGRSEELRAVVRCALADWKAGAVDTDRTADTIRSYMDGLHRRAAGRLPSGAALGCCGLQDLVTAVGGGERRPGATTDTQPSIARGAATARTRWVEPPEVQALFDAQLRLVEVQAATLGSRVSAVSLTMDDLRSWGREGLLDAARSFDASRGVPFDNWAAKRIRGAMIDGIRRWGRLQHAASSGAAMAIGSPQGIEAAESTPEEKLRREELLSLARDAVAQLPEPERVLLESHYLQGQPLKAVASRLGIDSASARRLMARALDRVGRAWSRA